MQFSFQLIVLNTTAVRTSIKTYKKLKLTKRMVKRITKVFTKILKNSVISKNIQSHQINYQPLLLERPQGARRGQSIYWGLRSLDLSNTSISRRSSEQPDIQTKNVNIYLLCILLHQGLHPVAKTVTYQT